ncbi:conserved Plasmodium protein, unknown function [Plasmodium ovale wallikeri]|nr:conserved Plasmodium protein, unknown function [Plasmodium ovale wallikeri]SBT56452.1 conserved Plasmodium protein, unknown function [Plasmodium ovale wallikeri]
MKNCNTEAKLIYRTLSDKFFVINKPVNWTLTKRKKKKEKVGVEVDAKGRKHDEKEAEFLRKNNNSAEKLRQSSGHTNEQFVNALRNLSRAEKNAFLFTNSSLYFYNDFNFTFGDRTSNMNACDGTFVEKHYIESVLQYDMHGEIYFPYKLPIYMSGLVICCRDHIIYRKFLQMINENKIIRKYRCLVHDPFSFDKIRQVSSFQREKDIYADIVHPLGEEYSENTYEQVKKNKEKNIGNKMALSLSIASLEGQKEASDFFPFHNFFGDNAYSSKYSYNLAELKIKQLKENMNYQMEEYKNERRNRGKMCRRGEKASTRESNQSNDHFMTAFLRKSPPIKSLNHFLLAHMKRNNSKKELDSGDVRTDHWKEVTLWKNTPLHIDHHEREEKCESADTPLYNCFSPSEEKKDLKEDCICNPNLNSLRVPRDGRVNFPLSLFFNEGNFFFFDKKIMNSSVQISMIYKVQNFEDYVRKKKKVPINYERGNSYVEHLRGDIYLVDFVLLDNHKPDLIRFLFSEMNTPIINDTVFDKGSLKRDIINEMILLGAKSGSGEHVPGIHASHGNSPNIFEDKYTDDKVEKSANEGTVNEDNIYREYMEKAYEPEINAFTIPNTDSSGCANNKKKIHVHNYFVCEMDDHKNMENCSESGNLNNKKVSTNNTSLCLELYQLQFIDPLNGDRINIENSLPRSWK